MPFPMKIQPIDSQTFRESYVRSDVVAKPVLRSRLKRLFDRPFTSVRRISWAAEKPSGATPTAAAGDVDYFEPSSLCLDKMVQNFIEENNEKAPQSALTSAAAMTSAKYGRNRCNCFNGNSNDDSSNDDFGFSDDSSDTLKSLIPCASTAERNLLADTSRIVEKNKAWKNKHDIREIVTDGLLALGYNASVCKSKWEKSSSIPAGEYEYIDVIIGGERILIDVDFRSEFEIARSTGSYKAMLQSLPFIFVGKTDRLLQIISIVSEAAKRSLKKKGMHVAPWRKAEYIKSKWLGSFTRATPPPPPPENATAVEEIGAPNGAVEEGKVEIGEDEGEERGELDLIFGEKATTFECNNNNSDVPPEKVSGEEEILDFPVRMTWQPPPVLTAERGNNKVIVTGLASLLMEKS